MLPRVQRSQLHGPIRAKLVEKLVAALGDGPKGIVVLQGGGPFTLYNTDNEGVFRQEANFLYLFGVMEESYYGAIDVRSGKSMLFMPKLPSSYAVWMGHIKSTDEVKAEHAVDEVHYVDDIASVLAELSPPVLHIMEGKHSDSGLPVPPVKFDGIEKFTLETATLYKTIIECRVYKTDAELAIMRHVSRIASAAHVAVMQHVKAGMVEYDCEAKFMYECYSKGGCRVAAYTPIAASGKNGAILHYGHAGAPNDKTVESGDMLLLDMGCEYYGYDSDITCSWPAGGKFIEEQKVVYNAVLAANKGVIKAMKPGVKWPDMHRLAERTILSGLKEAGFLTGDVEEMMEAYLGAVFMPHGLGHLLGIDTHDIGGYVEGVTPQRIDKPGIKNLRTARVLAEGMVLTVEPGCYFNHFLLNNAFDDPTQAKFLVKDKIMTCWEFGGVRIEDNVIVGPSGGISMTDVPRTVEEVEAVIAGQDWKPTIY